MCVSERERERGVCAICHEEMKVVVETDTEEEEVVVRVDPCGHEYHRRCIDRWLTLRHKTRWRSTASRRRTCPCCRQPCRTTTPLVPAVPEAAVPTVVEQGHQEEEARTTTCTAVVPSPSPSPLERLSQLVDEMRCGHPNSFETTDVFVYNPVVSSGYYVID